MAADAQDDVLQRYRALEERLDQAEEVLTALRSGEVDAIVVSGADGERVYTLKGADEAYRVMVEGMADGALTLTPEGLILFSNQRFAALMGRPLERIMGARLDEFVTPEDQAGLRELLAEHHDRKAELNLRTDTGETVPIFASVHNFVLDDVEHLCMIVTDLTEQKRTHAMIAAEKLARSILEQAAEAILVLDAAGRIVRASESADLLAGEPVLHCEFDTLFRLRLSSGEDYPFERIDATTRLLGKFNGVETRAKMRDGRDVPLLMSASTLSGAQGPLGCIITLTDISERTRAEQVLRDSEARFRRLYDANIIGLVYADSECILEANDNFLDMVGYTREDLQGGGIRWREMTPREYHRLDDRALEELKATGSCKPFEKEYFRKDGSRVPILIGASLLEASPVRWLCFILDLSERNRLQKKLTEKQKLESIGLLAGGIAHDFNNLLVGVMGNASLAREMLPPDSPLLRPLEGVIAASERAAHLTRQMLAYSGKGQFIIQDVNLSALVREAWKLMQSTVSSRISVNLELSPDLPPVRADAGQMQQVIMNLLMNAAEAIGDQPGIIGVRTATRTVDEAFIRELHDGAEIEPGLYVSLEVQDTGAGMDEPTLARIFDPFFTTKFTGRGLGLAAVSGVVRSHGGAITVTSAPGAGSTFLVLFPPAMASRRIQLTPELPAAKIGEDATILVVDDEQLVLRTATVALERRGYNVMKASSGAEAAEILRSQGHRISLVLLDWSMPGKSGEEILPELRKIRPDVKVIVSSGYSESEIQRAFAGQEIAAFLQKPYTSAVLVDKVTTVIRRV